MCCLADGDSEIAVGNTSGELAIFKAQSATAPNTGAGDRAVVSTGAAVKHAVRRFGVSRVPLHSVLKS